ncbi:MAG: toxin-antitoxin system HicB family antitoxin [Candidatus Binatia bacterium]
MSLRLPNSLHRRLSELAERDDVSINQLITSAVAEKMSALMAADYLEKRAARGSRAKVERALRKVPDSEPETYDRLPNEALQRTASSRPDRGGGRRRASKGARRHR